MMQISVENTGALGRRMTVAIPADRFEQAFANRLKRLSAQVRVPGFRPGKTPMKVLEARYGEQVMEEVAGELIQSTFREAIGQEQLKPVTGPLIEQKSLGRGKEFAYTAEFEVYPEIPKLDLKGRAIERPVCSITEEDVDRSIESLRRQRVSWQPAAREAREGDRLQVDFTGTIDGQAFEGSEATNHHVLLGGGGVVEGLEKGLTGACSGETRTLELKMPVQHPNAQVAGKTATFAISVKQVDEPILPALDDELARQFGIVQGGVERLRAQVRANLERELAQRLRSAWRTRVLDALVEVNEFELPRTLLQAEIEYVRRVYRTLRDRNAEQRSETTEETALYEQIGRRRLARSLILSEVIRANTLKPTPEAVRARVVEMAQEYESPEEFVRACYATPTRLAEIEAVIVEDLAVEHLLHTADVTEKPVSFQELVKLGNAPT
jgi:trigger factor